MNNTSSNPIPFGSCVALEYFVPTQWIDYAQPKEYDHGFVRLACTIGYESGILGFRTYTNSNFPTVLVGYPSDKQIHGEEMWYGFGSMTHSDAIFSYYSNDAVNGNSGSPVWQNGYPSCPFCIVAVHSNYFPTVPENGGPRVAGDLYAFLLYEKNYVTQQVFIPLIIWNE